MSCLHRFCTAIEEVDYNHDCMIQVVVSFSITFVRKVLQGMQ